MEIVFLFLFLDVDKFKKINDQYGHEFANQILKQLSKFLSSCIREADYCIRYGGDEFVILLLESSAQKAKIVAKRIIQKLQEHLFCWQDISLTLELSIGISSYPETARRQHELIKFADLAMYLAKKNNGNSLVIYDSCYNTTQ